MSQIELKKLPPISAKRKAIMARISNNVEKIKKLKKENLELSRKAVLISDKNQWFVEKMETVTYRENRKKIKVEQLIGRIHWLEEFEDDDTKEKIIIERREVVRVDGKWDW